MDMRKSLIVSTFIILLLVAVFCVIGKINDDKKAQQNYAMAKDDFKNNNLESALNLLKEEPPRKIAQDYYGLKYDVLMNLNKIYEAEIVAKKLIKLNKNNGFNHYLLSIIYYNLGDYEKTEKCLKDAIKYAPKNNDFKISLANTYSSHGKNAEAINLFEEVMKKDPKYEVAWAGIADIYENQQDYKKAIIYREDAAKKFANNVYDAYMLAQLYKKMGNKKDAAFYYAKAAKIDISKESDAEVQYTKLTGKPLYMSSVSSYQRIPVLFVHNYAIVDALADGINGKFLIDTGATSTVISERFLRKNRIKVETDTYGIATLANGKKEVFPATYFDFKLGESNFYNNRVYISPDIDDTITFDGIIGNDILAKTDFYIDRKNEVLVIKR